MRIKGFESAGGGGRGVIALIAICVLHVRNMYGNRLKFDISYEELLIILMEAGYI